MDFYGVAGSAPLFSLANRRKQPFVGIKIAVGIPTVGRAAILCETLIEFGRQTRRPEQIIICGAKPSDLTGASEAAPGVVLLTSKPGLPRQRNAIIDATGDADVLVFFDDDFLPHPHYLAEIERQFTENPQIVVATGKVLADGINGPGLSPAEGREILALNKATVQSIEPVFTGYGCNFAVRLAPMHAHGLRFDERLPLYGWQEDVDFCRCLAAYGQVCLLGAAQGVHLGVKLSRSPGLKLGYSQVANPLYLSGKRRGYPMRRAIKHIACNLAMNVLRATWPETYVDRRGRLRGNLLALRDLLLGRLVPERILEL
jgi:GT2 family glycosyltransferase